MPRRSDIDPAQIPAVLPFIMLLEPEDGRFRYRLVGSKIEEAYGIYCTGHYMDEVVAGDRRQVAQTTYMTVVETRRPVASRGSFITLKGKDLDVTRLLLPLSEDGESVTMILAAIDIPAFVDRENPALGLETVIKRDQVRLEVL